jgi:hypothetical protein
MQLGRRLKIGIVIAVTAVSLIAAGCGSAASNGGSSSGGSGGGQHTSATPTPQSGGSGWA